MSRFPAAEGWSAWPAPAKLNLFLHITGRRADGYHELQTVFRLLDWGDTVHLRPRADGVIARIGDGASGVAEADDLMVRAAILLKNACKCTQGADIGIEKRIPMGGGFGGGSSDAASVLVALNRLWGLGLDEDRLAELGQALGAEALQVTCSIGLSRLSRAEDGARAAEAILDRADRALLAAKGMGRDRVVADGAGAWAGPPISPAGVRQVVPA